MTLFNYLTSESFPITLKGVIDDIMDDIITVRGHKTGCKINMGDTPEEVERHLRQYLFAGEELTDDEHIFYVISGK